MEYPSRRRTCFAGAGAMPAYNANRVERLDLFLNGHSSAVAQSLFWTKAGIASAAVDYAKQNSRSHGAVIRVFNEPGKVIETHKHADDFKEP